MAAALCIGRRFLGFSEQMPQARQDVSDGKGGHVTLDLPARNRARHVWHQWRQLNQKLPAALTAHLRTAKADPRVLERQLLRQMIFRTLSVKSQYANRQHHCSADVSGLPMRLCRFCLDFFERYGF